MTAQGVLCATLLVLAAACGSTPKARALEAKGAPDGKPNRSKTMDYDSNNAFGLQTIHFPAVSLLVDEAERDKLVKNAEILKAHQKIMVEIEGHSDGRGKVGQSLELGDMRAKVVRDVMIALGVNESRLSTISYGKDRMLDRTGTEEGYAKNRRVNFLILRY
jgi:peptidoglycan-associated lipoprotein